MKRRRWQSPEAAAGHAPAISVSVVVAAWSSEAKPAIAACVDSLAKQTLTPREVVLVVDHNEELADWARSSLSLPAVVENRHERGVVGARNTGVEATTGDVLAFLDDDAAAAADWLERLAAPFAEPRVVGVGGELVPEWLGPEPRWMPHEFYWAFGCSYAGLPTELAPIRNPIGANMAVRRQALEAVGGFAAGVRPRTLRIGGRIVSGGHALDDTSLGIRVSRAFPDGCWLYQPAATVRHRVDPGRASFGYLLKRSFEEGEGKAALARAVGAESGLESERRHVAVAIPKGFARGFADLLRGDPYGPARSLALLAGTLAAASGYLLAAVRARLGPEAASEHAG